MDYVSGTGGRCCLCAWQWQIFFSIFVDVKYFASNQARTLHRNIQIHVYSQWSVVSLVCSRCNYFNWTPHCCSYSCQLCTHTDHAAEWVTFLPCSILVCWLLTFMVTPTLSLFTLCMISDGIYWHSGPHRVTNMALLLTAQFENDCRQCRQTRINWSSFSRPLACCACLLHVLGTHQIYEILCYNLQTQQHTYNSCKTMTDR